MDAVIADLVNPDNVFGHLGYIFIIASMMMTSLRWLRILALISGFAAMVHFMFITSDTVSFAWEVIFTLTNGVQLALLVYHSRKLNLTDHERLLVTETLGMANTSDQRSLLAQITWQDVQPGDILLRQGQTDAPLLFIASGAAGVEHDDALIAVTGGGDFLGEMSMITGNVASATVRASNAMRVARFDRAGLDQIFESSPSIRSAVSDAFNRGLSDRVVRLNRTAAGAA